MPLRPAAISRTLHTIGLLALVGTVMVGLVHAQPSRAPLPPSRPSLPPQAQTAPPTAAKPAVPTDDADLDPEHPPVLPAASRAKMHACGREWQEMKRRGADRDQTWRQFATACLTRTSAPN